MKSVRKWVMVAILCSSLACGTVIPNTPTQLSITQTTPPRPTTAPTPTPIKLHTIGEVIEVNGSFIVMNDADIRDGVLRVNFSIENKGTEPVFLGSSPLLEARDADGVVLDVFYDCDPLFNSDVYPGDKLKGNYCWKTTDISPYKVYYTDPWILEPVIWLITP